VNETNKKQKTKKQKNLIFKTCSRCLWLVCRAESDLYGRYL